VSRTTLLRLDAAVFHSVLAVVAKNWKDAATVLFLGFFLYAVGREYAIAASETARFYATIFASFLCGYVVVSFVELRLDRLSEASPFAEESLDGVQSKIYLGTWSLASLLLALFIAALIYPSGLLDVVATWFGAGMLSFAVSAYRKVAETFDVSDKALLGLAIGRLAGITAAVIAVGAIGLQALASDTPDSLEIVMLAANGAAAILLSPVKADEIQFLRIIGHGFTQRCATAVLPILVLTGINCALVFVLLDNLPMMASIAIVSFGIMTYRILQIGFLRLMSARAAEVALGLYILSLLVLGMTFPPLAAVVYGLVLVVVWWYGWRATWLMK